MKILSKPKGNAEEYGRWSVNPYVGCPHGCEYCYLKKGVWANTLGGSVPVLKTGIVNEEHAYHVAMAEIIENREQIIKDGGLFMTFTSDPCINETRQLFLRIAEKASSEHGIPVMMLTKAADFMSECDSGVYLEADQRFIWPFDKIAYGWTLTGHDELEPNAPSNKSRIEVMRLASKEAKYIWASIEPVITFDASFEMIQEALDAGCLHFKIGLMTKNTKVCRRMYEHGACIEFIHNVMRAVSNKDVTVYWKQSFRDFLGEEDFARATIGWHNIVGKDYSMFTNK